MNNDDINNFVPSLLNPRCIRKGHTDISLTQNSVASRASLSLRKCNGSLQSTPKNKIKQIDKENSQNIYNSIPNNIVCTSKPSKCHNKVRQSFLNSGSLGFSEIEDLQTKHSTLDDLQTVKNFSIYNFQFIKRQYHLSPISYGSTQLDKTNATSIIKNGSLISVSSATDLSAAESDITLDYYRDRQPAVAVSFAVQNCDTIDINTNKNCFKRMLFSHKNNTTNIECEIIENTQLSIDSEKECDTSEFLPSPPKKQAVAVNLEIKKKKLTEAEDTSENDKVLILKTNAIEKFSHVIIQPPNYKLVKRKILDESKLISSKRKRILKYRTNNVKSDQKLNQTTLDCFFKKSTNVLNSVKGSLDAVSAGNSQLCSDRTDNVVCDKDMSKNSGVTDAVKCEQSRPSYKGCRISRDNELSPKSTRVSSSKRGSLSPRCQDIRISCSEAPRVPSPRPRNDSITSHSPKVKIDSIQFSLPPKSKSNKASVINRNIPHHKIVAGTHFAVDAFSYGDIPNVKHYFLTHFHSDHYSGLKKAFGKLLFCSQITADLCISRLGVNPKCIHVINVDETLRIDGVEVTAVEANHCPGAVMLIFTLPNGKTLLHTGDFRASPIMESYPIFWNKDIHTVYLDTTYCNPRYDFPTQDQSLEMALYILRQKKLNMERLGKKFASVLIVCGTYTIGKEKFFLGMARRVGCSVWACPEKDRVLQTVEGRSFSHAPPQSCQLHVVPMRDLTHEKLKNYLDSLQGAYTEVVAFKPSGWENGKNSSVEKDKVTIHGIPYSEHSSFSELIRFVKFLNPKQVVPTVDISGGVKAVQKYFPCPLVCKEDHQSQSKLTDYFSIHNRHQAAAVT